MFVKVYRYRIRRGMLEQYKAVQSRAARLYEQDSGQRSVYFQSTSDHYEWMEIHWFTSQQQYRASVEQMNLNPQWRDLWQEFQATLDPQKPGVFEEFEEHPWKGNSSPEE